ncbi:Fe-S protein assembly co-chaperone HscB [Cognatazoarcus halotolerans]|uniref:Fe-S protein assembly co-chaperone HscB n=1 Tax=Cognatazoarcus halotolerans TaxID=2686016 RepID=UPI001357D2AF|nr:Fe-S protein assembly co-chaperone HscB [Cognatazoarcus halotolerans]MBX3679029.1 Fe-S protein assembly co-chaperone HscB [Rhodocyclaceae bacterium]MCB1900195.1 Fe-S protein assembly co-chaperone HscB [Rhodocyclaceae bacterium]MCP5309024.1 Fe-S protein assembly co-chaperone HscB [Zoogloeaceae bacterium]
MPVDLQHDFFTLFGLETGYSIDQARLEHAYLELQSEVHPDRFAHLSDAEKRLSMQWATRVNEAYRTLRKPLTRAQYLLELRGVDAGLETNTAMSPAFLMEQMEWREAVEEARDASDADALDDLLRRLRIQTSEIHGVLAGQLSDGGDLQAAAETVRRLMFIGKLENEIDDALEALDP